MTNDLNTKRESAATWFKTLRDSICSAFEMIEDDYTGAHHDQPAGRFERKTWDRPGGGGGTMSIMRGRVFEKVGVNISAVDGRGRFDKEGG